ncbi:hypothetical protein F7725_002444, partial [Dissostichus mawsoni]
MLGARLHGAADHEAVARLEHVQRAGDGGGHGAHEDRDFLFDFGPVGFQRDTHQIFLQRFVVPPRFTQRRGFQTVSLEQINI